MLWYQPYIQRNHYEAMEVSGYGNAICGRNQSPVFFVAAGTGATFEAPEAVMVYSPLGYNGMSQCMHRFVREHIVRGTWKKKTRPVHLNSWEASYF